MRALVIALVTAASLVAALPAPADAQILGKAASLAGRAATRAARRAAVGAGAAATAVPDSADAANRPAAATSAAPTAQATRRGATPPAAKPDSQAKAASTSVSKRGTGNELTFSREVFSYPGQGRRDPFLSLLKSGDLRPLLSDLRLVTVLFDPTGRNSVAILRDMSTKDQYRVKAGQQLGRMRVAQIQPKHVVFTINEFGYSRQETLGLVADTTSARTR